MLLQTPLTDDQISSLIDKLVPIVAAPADAGVFRFALREMSRAEPIHFLLFCKKTLEFV